MIAIREFSPDEPRFLAVLKRGTGDDTSVDDVVAPIVASVGSRGDEALFEHMQRLDNIDLRGQPLMVSEAEFATARRSVPAAFAQAVREACENVRAFHEHQVPFPYTVSVAGGGSLTRRYHPIERVGVTVPSDIAPLASSVYMNVIPAQVAGVRRLSIIAAPKQGGVHPLILFIADHLGVRDVYKISGPQGIAALAFGTETIPAVDKIVGPGNAYVQTAKKQVFGQVGIDGLAGPSEIVVIADDSARDELVAVDLLAQAEHGTGHEVAVAFVTSADQARRISTAASRLVSEHGLTGAEAAFARYGTLFVVDSLADAVDATNTIAPEHAEVMCEDAASVAAGLTTAGALFVGPHSPEALGDYYCGANHVLPTRGTARFASGLSVLDFLRGATQVTYDRSALQHASDKVGALAEAEGMHAHGLSTRLRLNHSELRSRR